MAWYNASWNKRKAITLDSDVVVSTQTNIPCLIYRSADTEFVASALSSGDDIVFVDDDETTLLDYEVLAYDNSTGAITVYVKVPSLSSVSDTTIYAYYGNSGASNQEDPAGLWADYAGVWHLQGAYDGTANEVVDSTANGYHGVSANTTDPTQTSIGNGLYAQAFNGSDTAIDTGGVDFAAQTDASIIIWANTDNTTGSHIYGQRWGTFSWMQTLDLRQKSTEPRSGGIVNTDTAQGGDDDTLHSAGGAMFWCAAWSASDEIYHTYSLDVDDTLAWSDVTASISGTEIATDGGRHQYLGIGDTTRQNGSAPFDGLLWLARAAYTTFSADYLQTTAQIEADPDAWATFGSEETDGITISASAATLASAGQAASVTPGAITVSATASTLGSSGQSASVASGAISITTSAATLDSAGQSASITPGVATVQASVSTLAGAGQSASVTLSGVTINATVSTITGSGQSASLVPGAISITASTGTLSGAGQSATISGIVSVTASVATLSGSGFASTITPGSVSVLATAGTLVFSGQSASADNGAGLAYDPDDMYTPPVDRWQYAPPEQDWQYNTSTERWQYVSKSQV